MNMRVKQQTIRIIEYYNPFDKRISRSYAYPVSGDTTLRLIYNDQQSCAEYNHFFGGKPIGFETPLPPGSTILRVRKIKGDNAGDIVGILAMVAAIATGNVIAAGAAWGMTSYAAAAALMAVGGMIASAFERPEAEKEKEKPNYTWDTPKPTLGQGAAVGITWGQIKIRAPQILTARNRTEGNNNYLALVLAGGEGPLDEITDIKLNGSAIETYHDYTLETRLGTNEQEPLSIPMLKEATSDVILDKLITTDPEESQTNVNTATALEIVLYFPNAMYGQRNSSDAKDTYFGLEYVHPAPLELLKLKFSLTIKYRITGSGAAWSERTVTIERKTIAPFYHTEKIDGLPIGQYDVTVERGEFNVYYSPYYIAKYYSNGASLNLAGWWDITRTDQNALRLLNACVPFETEVHWVKLSSAFDVYPRRPGKALVALSILATNQISGGMPTIEWTQSRTNVWVWDPHEGESGEYVQKPADNPWWAAYDLIHYARRWKNIQTDAYEIICYGARKEMLLYDDFKTCADYADEKGLKFDYYMDSTQALSDALKIMCDVGRGAIVIRGSKYGAVCDMPKEPTGMFCFGNIKDGEFSGAFLPVTGRANRIEINYLDMTVGEMMALPVYETDWDDSLSDENPTQIQLLGITRREQAYQQGKYYLRSNLYHNRNLSFSAGIDSLTCEIGDVVLIQHDVPQWRNGGRVLSQPTGDTVKLDRKISFDPEKDYNIYIRHSESDELGIYACEPADGEPAETDLIKVTEPMAISLLPYDDIYVIGDADIPPKPFKVHNMVIESNFRRRLELHEYDERVFDDADPGPEIAYTTRRYIVDVIDLEASGVVVSADNGVPLIRLAASWQLPPNEGEVIVRYHISVSIDGEAFEYIGSTTSLEYLTDRTFLQADYYIKVQAENNLGQWSTGVISDPIIIDYSMTVPFDLDSLVISLTGGRFEPISYTLAFQASDITVPANFVFVEFRLVQGNTSNWDAGIVVGTTTAYMFQPAVTMFDTYFPSTFWGSLKIGSVGGMVGQYTFMAKVKNTSGTYSNNEASVLFDVPVPDFSQINGQYEITVINHYAEEWDLGSPTINGGEISEVDGFIYADEIEEDEYDELIFETGAAQIGGMNGFVNLYYDAIGISDVFYNIDESGWIPYRGQFALESTQYVNLRVRIVGGDVQGVLKQLYISFSVPLRQEIHPLVTIPDEETREAPYAVFTKITKVEITLQWIYTHPAVLVTYRDPDPTLGAAFLGWEYPGGGNVAARFDVVYTGY